MSNDPVTTQEAQAARDAWKDAVESLDIERTVSLYDPERGRLLGTMDTGETTPRRSPERIRDYFESFLDKDALRATFRHPVTEANLQQLGPGHAAHSGYYEFALSKGGRTQVARATYTYVYGRAADGRLLILTHNSGLTPEGIAE